MFGFQALPILTRNRCGKHLGTVSGFFLERAMMLVCLLYLYTIILLVRRDCGNEPRHPLGSTREVIPSFPEHQIILCPDGGEGTVPWPDECGGEPPFVSP